MNEIKTEIAEAIKNQRWKRKMNFKTLLLDEVVPSNISDGDVVMVDVEDYMFTKSEWMDIASKLEERFAGVYVNFVLSARNITNLNGDEMISVGLL